MDPALGLSQRLNRLDGCCHVLNTLSTLISCFPDRVDHDIGKAVQRDLPDVSLDKSPSLGESLDDLERAIQVGKEPDTPPFALRPMPKHGQEHLQFRTMCKTKWKPHHRLLSNKRALTKDQSVVNS